MIPYLALKVKISPLKTFIIILYFLHFIVFCPFYHKFRGYFFLLSAL